MNQAAPKSFRVALPARLAREGLAAAAALLVGLGVGWNPGVASASASPAIQVFVGYADGLRGSSPNFPSPWNGDPNVTFVGNPGSSGFDAGAIRIDNYSSSSLSIGGLSVDVGDTSFNTDSELWSELSVPAADENGPGRLIVTQTSDGNFDTSDVGPPGACGEPNDVVPVVHVTMDETTTDYTDAGQVLNTGGVDLANCPSGTNESHRWSLISGSLADLGVTLSAAPDTASAGARVQFHAEVTNNGPDAATGAGVTETLTSGSWVSASLPAGCSLSTSTVVACNLGAIAKSDAAAVDLTATAPTSGSSFTDTATVSADQADPNPDNDAASASVALCTDCTGGFVSGGGTVSGPPINHTTVTQTATLIAPPNITGVLSSDNISTSPCSEPAGFETYGDVFKVLVPPTSPGQPYIFKLTLESSNNPALGVPIQEPVGRIQVLRKCVLERHCRELANGSSAIPRGQDGCLVKIQRMRPTGNVAMTLLDDGSGGDPPIHGGG